MDDKGKTLELNSIYDFYWDRVNEIQILKNKKGMYEFTEAQMQLLHEALNLYKDYIDHKVELEISRRSMILPPLPYEIPAKSKEPNNQEIQDKGWLDRVDEFYGSDRNINFRRYPGVDKDKETLSFEEELDRWEYHYSDPDDLRNNKNGIFYYQIDDNKYGVGNADKNKEMEYWRKWHRWREKCKLLGIMIQNKFIENATGRSKSEVSHKLGYWKKWYQDGMDKEE